MTDEKKKEFRGHVIAMGISIAAGYFTAQVQLNELFSFPSYVYTSIWLFVGVLILHRVFAFIRFIIVNYRDSKQKPFPSINFYGSRRPQGQYMIEQWMFDGFIWKVEFNVSKQQLYETYGPYCPKEECHTELNVRRTYFGRHKYECPACSFKKTVTANAHTLESNLEKVSKAKFAKKNEKWQR